MANLTVADLPPTPFRTFTADTSAVTARAAAQSNEAILIQTADGRPLGVIPPEDVAQLTNPTLHLTDYRHLWRPLTYVLASTLIDDVLRAMNFDKQVRWLVVLQGQTVVRVLSPKALFAEAYSKGLLLTDTFLSGAIYGDPVSEPSGLCYQCTAEPAHIIPPAWVKDRTVDGQALCPCDGSPMHVTFACPQEFRPC